MVDKLNVQGSLKDILLHFLIRLLFPNIFQPNPNHVITLKNLSRVNNCINFALTYWLSGLNSTLAKRELIRLWTENF